MPTSTPIRKQSSVTKAEAREEEQDPTPAGERSRTPIADSIETVARGLAHLVPLRRIHACKDPNCAPRQRFFALPARTRADEEEDELSRRRKMRRSLLDGTGEGGGMPCGWPEWNCSPLL